MVRNITPEGMMRKRPEEKEIKSTLKQVLGTISENHKHNGIFGINKKYFSLYEEHSGPEES